jgi:YD repeat-containing protein
VAAVSPGGLRRGFEYDAEDNLLLYTDAAGHQTRFAYMVSTFRQISGAKFR